MAATIVEGTASAAEAGVGDAARSASAVDDRFVDVATTHTHARAIEAMAETGLTTGCAPGRFCPAEPLSRAQMASVLARGFGLPAATMNRFRDVRAGSTHAGTINALIEAGFARGCADGRFCPEQALTRAQAASVLANALGLEPTGRSSFSDLRGGVHDRAILALADEGLSYGCGSGRFCGAEPLSRAQFASLLYRATDYGTVQLASRGRHNGGDGGAPGGPTRTRDDSTALDLRRTSVGSPSPSGTLRSSDGVHVLAGAGSDIWGTRDSFEFAHQSVSGDVSVVTRVTSQSNTDPWAKAGLMIRDGVAPDASHVSLFQTPANGVSLQYRERAGGQSSRHAGHDVSVPTWLRLDRSGDDFRAYTSVDGVRWTLAGTATVSLAAVVLVGFAVTSHLNGSLGEAEFSDVWINGIAGDGYAPAPSIERKVDDGLRLLYSADDVSRFQSSMAKPGPFYVSGDAGHGGQYSPNDGQRSVALARDFLADPQASYWIQPNLPFASGDPSPSNMVYVRPMHAAWVYMTQPTHPDRDALRREVKALLLHHATHSSHDFSNATNYPVNYLGFAPSPIFEHAHWMTRLIKARDMLGRDSFTAAENATLDRWFYDYANWTFKWLHHEHLVKQLPGRENRDYTRINAPADASRSSYDGGPLIGSLAMAYTNRHAAVASTASLAANYLKLHGYTAPSSGGPSYGRFTVDQLLLHSRLFVEETIRFSVYPQGVQGDFERGDSNYHNATPQQGWLYSVNVLANLVEMAEYHAKRGDLSVWNYGTTAGYDGTAGVPVAGGFPHKNLHFYAWSMSRYVNNGWNRTNRSEPLTLSHFYHDVIPAATAARFAPNDTLLRDAWRRSGSNFPAYPQSPQSQGRWHAHTGEGAKMIGLIEHANGNALRRPS